MSEIARIRVQGELFDAIVIEGHWASCGNLRDGVPFRLHDNHKTTQDAGGVLDWHALEAAYLAIKAQRDAYGASVAAEPNGADAKEGGAQ